MNKKVDITVYKNITGTNSLVVENKDLGYRVQGADLHHNMPPVAKFTVDAKEFRKLITEYQYEV